MSEGEGGECVVMEGLIPVTAFYDPRTEPGITSCSWGWSQCWGHSFVIRGGHGPAKSRTCKKEDVKYIALFIYVILY